MSVLKTLKLSQVAPAAAPANPKDRARTKIIQHLEQQRALLAAQLEGKAFEATRPVYKANEAGERVRVMQPVHVRRGWFEDANGTVFFRIRYGAKPLPLDRAGNTAVEVGKIDALPAAIEALIRAVRAGELDAQAMAAAQERGRVFKRRAGTGKAA